VRAGVTREVIAGRHDAERAVAVRERDEPGPDVSVRRIDADPDLLPIEGARDDAILDVAEPRRADRKARRLLELEEPRQRAAKAAGIEDEAGPIHRDVAGL